ncbi:MAG: aldehyde dehydrogenase family protein [Verrucomicrobiota bacterium]
MRQIDHFLAGGSPAASRFGDIMDPNNGGVQAQVALGDRAVLDKAVAAAQAAQPAWAATNPQRRARVMFNFKALVEKHMDELAEHALVASTARCSPTARATSSAGLRSSNSACGIPHVLKGEYTQGAGPGIDVYSMRQPIGIGAGITPFNFPAMIPLWMGARGDRALATPSS